MSIAKLRNAIEEVTMVAFLVENFTSTERRLIKQFVRKCKIDEHLVYSLNKDDTKKGAEHINVNEKFYAMQCLAFSLLDRDQKWVHETAETLANIVGLDLDMFTQRVLLNKVFYKEAQFLIGEEMLRGKGLKEVIILSKYRNILTSKNGVIYYSDMLNAVVFLRAVAKYSKKILVLISKRLVNLKERFPPVKHKKHYDVIAIQFTPLCYRLVRRTIELLAKKYAIAIAAGFNCSDELIEFEVCTGVDKIKIAPVVRFRDFLKIAKIFHLLKLGKFKWEIISISDDILLRQKIAEYVAKELRPRVILVKNEYDLFENVEYAVFRKYGVKYVDYMHGEKLCNLRDSLLEYDKMAVWGRHYKELFEGKLRAKSGMVKVVGNQLFDDLPSHRIKNRNLLEIRNNYRKIISVFTRRCDVLFPEVNVSSQSVMMDKIARFMEKNKDIYMVLKHHPLELRNSIPTYDSPITRVKGRVLECVDEIELYDILLVSDLVVTSHSTVGLEAILLKKPVLFMNFGDTPHLLEYPNVNAAVEINKPGDSEFYLKKMLFDKEFVYNLDYEKVIEDWANGLDGKSHIRMKKLIEEELNQATVN